MKYAAGVFVLRLLQLLASISGWACTGLITEQLCYACGIVFADIVSLPDIPIVDIVSLQTLCLQICITVALQHIVCLQKLYCFHEWLALV